MDPCLQGQAPWHISEDLTVSVTLRKGVVPSVPSHLPQPNSGSILPPFQQFWTWLTRRWIGWPTSLATTLEFIRILSSARKDVATGQNKQASHGTGTREDSWVPWEKPGRNQNWSRWCVDFFCLYLLYVPLCLITFVSFILYYRESSGKWWGQSESREPSIDCWWWVL